MPKALLEATSVAAAAVLAFGLSVGAAAAAGDDAHNNTTAGSGTTTAAGPQQKQSDAQELVNDATRVVRKMKQDQKLAQVMEKAKGIYIVPEFGRGAFIVGGRGGAGVLLAHDGGKWSNPAFYDFGAISIGAQAGGSGGSVAFLLMSDGAVDAFKSGNKISLNAESGLSIVNYSANAQASWGKGDIVMWSDTKGAYAGATVSVTDINWDDDNNREYYGKKAEVSEILNGKVSNAGADALKQALPG